MTIELWTFGIDAAGLYRVSIAFGNYGVADYFENFIRSIFIF